MPVFLEYQEDLEVSRGTVQNAILFKSEGPLN